MKNKTKFLTGFVIVGLLAGIFYSRIKTVRVSEPEKSSALSAPPSPSPLPQVRTEKKVNVKETQADCSEKILRKIAKDCGTACLFHHVRKKDPELTTMLEELTKLPKNPRTKIARFFGAYENFVDLENQRDLLRKLAKEDRENAYPAFFLATLYLESNPPKARAIIEEALTRKYYESYTTQYLRRLKSATIDRPEVYAEAFVYSRDLPIFNLNTSVLWNFDRFDPELAKKVALKIIEPTLDNNGQYAELLWSREDYLMSRYMLSKVDPTENSLHPEYDVEDSVLERLSPGLTQKCDESEFIAEREREKLRLQNLPKTRSP
jgi:hypothetical protein